MKNRNLVLVIRTILRAFVFLSSLAAVDTAMAARGHFKIISADANYSPVEFHSVVKFVGTNIYNNKTVTGTLSGNSRRVHYCLQNLQQAKQLGVVVIIDAPGAWNSLSSMFSDLSAGGTCELPTVPNPIVRGQFKGVSPLYGKFDIATFSAINIHNGRVTYIDLIGYSSTCLDVIDEANRTGRTLMLQSSGDQSAWSSFNFVTFSFFGSSFSECKLEP